MKSTLLVLFVILVSCSLGIAQCKKIQVDTTITHTQNGLNNGKIVLKFKNSKKEDFSITLFPPAEQPKLNLNKTEMSGLGKGKYLVMIVGNRREDKYCPSPIEVTVN